MFKKYIRQVVFPSTIDCNWCILMPGNVSDTNSDTLLMNNKRFYSRYLLLWSEKSDELKDDESTGKPGEASKDGNGNQRCIGFENALFFQDLRACSNL